jgi:hypothetical protein
LKLVLTSALFGALFLVSGCATQCESVCTPYTACKLSERSFSVDCANFCGMVDAFDKRATQAGVTGCDQKWTAHLQCWQKNLKSICDNTVTDCDQTASDWSDCVNQYCAGLTADQYDPECDSGEALMFSPFQSGI